MRRSIFARSIVAAMVAALGFGLFASAQDLDVYHDKANWQDAYQQVMQAGSEATGVSVKVTPYADTSTYQAAVRAALRTPRAPGMFTWWSGFRMKDLVDAGLVADVSDIWKKYTDAGKVSPSMASAFTFDGKIYAVPNNVAYWVVFYNKKVFADNNLSVPTTWAEVEDVAGKLKDAGVTPFSATVDGRWPAFIWFEEFMIRSDPDLYNRLMLGEAKYTDPGVQKVFATWKDWIDKGWFTDPSTSFGTAGTNAMANQFAQGKLGMILVGTWYAATIQQAGMSMDDVGAFIMPNMSADTQPGVIFEAGPLLVSQNSSQKDAALKMADYWMSADAQQKWVDAQDFPPINSDVHAKSALIGDLVTQIQQGNYNQINRFWEATPPEIAEAAVDELSNFMLHPDTADQVMSNLQALAEKYWSSH